MSRNPMLNLKIKAFQVPFGHVKWASHVNAGLLEPVGRCGQGWAVDSGPLWCHLSC